MKPIVLILFVSLVDLNTATLRELDQLPGIGPVIAGRILEFREKRGGFRTVEEMLAIQGISERMWLELRDRVRVGESDGGVVAEAPEAGSGTGKESGGPDRESEDTRKGPSDTPDSPAQERAR